MGFRWAHFRTARTTKGAYLTPQAGHPGFPDAVLVRPPRVLFVEFKSVTGRIEPEQALWLDALRRSEVEVYIWLPAHWRSGEIEEVLR